MYWKYIKMYDLCEEHTVDICNILPGIHAFPGVTPIVVLMGKASKLFESWWSLKSSLCYVMKEKVIRYMSRHVYSNNVSILHILHPQMWWCECSYIWKVEHGIRIKLPSLDLMSLVSSHIVLQGMVGNRRIIALGFTAWHYVQHNSKSMLGLVSYKKWNKSQCPCHSKGFTCTDVCGCYPTS